MPTGVLLPLPRLGLPTPTNGDRLFFYEPGTTTPRNTYTTSALSVANSNPLVANSAGLFGAIYLDPALAYKVVFARAGSDDPPSSPVFTEDAIPADAAASDLDVIATAGEALAAGDVVYLSDGSGSRTPGRWYKGDADLTYASTAALMIGMVSSAIASGANGFVRLQGRVTGLSGLTAGTEYFVSGTAGTLTATAPTNARFVGVADSTTSLVLGPHPSYDGLALIRPVMQDYAEALSSPAISANVLTLNLANGNVFDVTLNANVTTLTISGAPASGKCGSFTLIVQFPDNTARTVTWPASVVWASNVTPTLTCTTNERDILTFLTVNGGTTWFASPFGQDFRVT